MVDAKRCNWLPMVRFASSFFAGVPAKARKLTAWAHRVCDTLPPTSGESHDDPLPCPNGLSEVRSELVLELYGSLRTGRREVSGRATRPDHGRRHAAEALGHPSRQP